MNAPVRGRPVNEDRRWTPDLGVRCEATIEHRGEVYGCVYGDGHDEDGDCDHGASVLGEYESVAYDIMWTDGGRLRVTPGDYWTDADERACRREGALIREVVYR